MMKKLQRFRKAALKSRSKLRRPLTAISLLRRTQSMLQNYINYKCNILKLLKGLILFKVKRM